MIHPPYCVVSVPLDFSGHPAWCGGISLTPLSWASPPLGWQRSGMVRRVLIVPGARDIPNVFPYPRPVPLCRPSAPQPSRPLPPSTLSGCEGGRVSRGYTIQNVVHASSLLLLFSFLLRGGMGGAGRGRRGAGCIPRCRLESPGAARAFNARSGGCGPLYHSPSQHRAGERPGGLITTTRGDQHVMTLTPLFIPQSSGTCAGGWPSKPSPAHTSPQKPRRFSPLPSLVRGASAALVSSLPSPSVRL